MTHTKQLISLTNTLRTHSITCTLENNTLHLPALHLTLETSSQTIIYDSQFNIIATFYSPESALKFILEMNKLSKTN
jgi:hypothetical protein